MTVQKHDPGYEQIVSVVSETNKLWIAFANGKRVAIKHQVLLNLASYSGEILWREVRVIDEGLGIGIPTKGSRMLEFDWVTLRQLTDEVFAEDVLEQLTEQNRFLGSCFRQWREEQKMSIREVAQYSGLDQGVIIRAESGIIQGMEEIRSILKALNRSFGDFANPKGR